jgi:hypothetical protein
MKHSLGTLPDTGEELHCANHSHELNLLPRSLKVLKISGSNFNHSLGLLPNGLIELDLSNAIEFQQPLGVLPQSLQCIKLHSSYAHIDEIRASTTAEVVIVTPTAAAVDTASSNSKKWFKRAAVAVATAAVTSAVLYGARELLISYMLRTI